MKCKILKVFKDIHTDEIYEVGQIVEFTKSRIKEIKKYGNFIEEINDESGKASKSSNKSKKNA